MTPDAAAFFEKAHKLLREADVMLGAGLNDAAGRNAYLASFHAAQALILVREGKTHKTHNGVQTEFLRITKDDSRVGDDMRRFLSRSYNLKAIADYETGPGSEIDPERARDAVAMSKAFVVLIAGIVHDGAA